MHGDELIGGHLSIKLHDSEFVGRLSPNSSAPSALLSPDADDTDDGASDGGGCAALSSRRSMPGAADTSASDSVDTEEGTLQDLTADRRVSPFVMDVNRHQRHKIDQRRKSSFGHVAYSLDREAKLARKVEIS